MADQFSRNKMRWLNSIFYDPRVGATTCRIAYLIGDYLNRVTHDCWPAQTTVARRLGISTKTVNRGVSKLKSLGYLKIKRGSRGHTSRYSPIFKNAEKTDGTGRQDGHVSPESPDTPVRQSYELNLHKSFLKAGADPKQQAFGRRDRGRLEVEIAARLGPNGMETLQRLAEIDDGIVDRMCDAQQKGALNERDLNAAVLAARSRKGE